MLTVAALQFCNRCLQTHWARSRRRQVRLRQWGNTKYSS